ncbi:methyltransferase domain-containing protein [Synechococcus sp. BMK-MC-1]|uniref:methyltransferase domain-containing protein n=1 Tax=Synechococcus sp. BMK-MC-1 TaxID=1442551 RepID=UPI001645CE34|nr:methyltransferase domain-containing protein [Synechococcus sp. BMK-MC-1]
MHVFLNGPKRSSLYYAKALLSLSTSINSIIDFGAADGVVSSVIGESSGATYFGIDVGAPIYSRSGNVEYVENPALLMELLSSKTADAVVAFNVLEHADDFAGVARTLFLQSRRYVMISLPNEMSLHRRLSFLLGRLWETQAIHATMGL